MNVTSQINAQAKTLRFSAERQCRWKNGSHCPEIALLFFSSAAARIEDPEHAPEYPFLVHIK